MRIIFATLLLFAACGHPRCLDVSVHVASATEGTVRVLAQEPDAVTAKYDEATRTTQFRVRTYQYYGRTDAAPVAEVVQLELCEPQAIQDTELVRISAWIEPPDSEPLECDDRIVCPPEGAPYAETFVTFVREGDTQATLDL